MPTTPSSPPPSGPQSGNTPARDVPDDAAALRLGGALLAGTALAVLLTDGDGSVLQANEAALVLFGLDGAPPPGTPAWDLAAPHSRDNARAMILEALHDGAGSMGSMGSTGVLHLAGRGGRAVTAQATFLAVAGESGGRSGLAILARDITAEHEETEKLRRGTLDIIRLNAELRSEYVAKQVALQSLEELSGRLKGVLEAASRVVIVATSQSGVITMFNPGASNLLGFRPEEMEGLETPLAFLDEDELALRGRSVSAAEGRSIAGVGVLAALARSGRKDFGEWTLVRKDGSRFAAELALSAIEGKHGVEGYLLVGVDVSGRKHAQEAMREREARLRAILDGAADGIITVDQHGRIESLNSAAASMFGYSLPELQGRAMEDIAPGALQGRHARGLGPVREVSGWRKDGRRFPMELSVAMVDLPSKPLRTCIMRDITPRRKAEEAQRQFTQRLAQQQADMERDLKAAAEIQKSLLPKDLPPDPRFTARWLFAPSATIGGDIFNILWLDENRIAVYMLDVSGHGVPSALVAAAAAQALQFHSLSVGWAAHSSSGPAPDRVLTALDMEFPLERFDRYFSLVYFTVDLERMALCYCNGGHPPPLLVRAGGGVEELHEGGTVIGLAGLLPFQAGQATLDPGDTLVLYTDGLTEFENASGKRFGMARLRKWLDATAGLPVDARMDALRKALESFGGKASPQDDLTVLVITFA
ncbi:SpoIIE family protein phosphatase [Fundidesulfovibrio putealis]|uniref:SpoIIE family protein phosphatase n=1 Tax=Fundidesulfovibrio putealis TaxID=270496 RepID=UPI000A049E39|nr:PAS domain S-box protein [Fundidesulfovibrio putealis]